MSEAGPELLRPVSPMAHVPGGFMTLERYSSVKRFWDIIGGLHRAGVGIEVPARAQPEECRRAIVGVRREGAGALLDVPWLLVALEEEDASLASFTLPDEARSAVSALLAGDAKGVQGILSRDYRLEFDLVLGFTQSRSLVLKAEAVFRPKSPPGPFPEDWKLRAVRWGRDEYKMLLERLSGAISRIPR